MSTIETIYVQNELTAIDTLLSFTKCWTGVDVETSDLDLSEEILSFFGKDFSIDAQAFNAPPGPKAYVHNLVKFKPNVRLSLFYSRDSDIEQIRTSLVEALDCIISTYEDWDVGVDFEYEGLALIYVKSQLYLNLEHKLWDRNRLNLLTKQYSSNLSDI